MKSSILIYILHVSLVNFSPDTEFTSVTKNGTCLSNQPKWWNYRYRILIINGLTVYVPKSSDIYKFNFNKNVKLKRLKNLQVTNYSNFIKQAGWGGDPITRNISLIESQRLYKILQSDETDLEEDSMEFWYSICVVFNFNTWSLDFVLTLINIGN